jgi:hypothetical protein
VALAYMREESCGLAVRRVGANPNRGRILPKLLPHAASSIRLGLLQTSARNWGAKDFAGHRGIF